MYKRLVEEKMWRKIAKLDTKLDIFLQCNKAITLTVIFSVKQKSFLSLQEKKIICLTLVRIMYMTFNFLKVNVGNCPA